MVQWTLDQSGNHRTPLLSTSPGLFVAMLAIGGGWGRLVGLAVQRIVGGVSALPVSLPAYTIVGAAAMLGEPPCWTI